MPTPPPVSKVLDLVMDEMNRNQRLARENGELRARAQHLQQLLTRTKEGVEALEKIKLEMNM